MFLKRLLGFKSDNFFFTYFEEDQVPSYYIVPDKAEDSGQIVYKDFHSVKPWGTGLIFCIPPYLDFGQLLLREGYSAITLCYRSGYLLDFAGFESPDQYLKKQLGSRALKKINRDFRRLDEKHVVTFEAFFGEIEKKSYQRLMDAFQEMIRDRFAENADEHTALQRWDFYRDSVFDLILIKKASLFVMYGNGVPISLALNYHKGTVLDSAVTTFKNDMASYGLGKLMLVKKIQWCFEHGYDKMDLRWGDFEHKKKLANRVYTFKNQIIYRKGNIIARMRAQVLAFLLKIKQQRQ
ncbi:GNAT family N-acetyltransferase [Robiginitalea marina]|uniref:GNAT family N-acetyltransferase n=1 Tax=Robiginitalea marina TaxID=2954105 RepID=A0ABT1AUY5_9FLAO|nr:GNAT family N-acetyltransferase [Robiginitalea marina]MCO5723350.1 GNAT family N-acetyltransferase [Robiginitalea marina]